MRQTQLFTDIVTEVAYSACISDCGRYRYTLTRTWNKRLPVLAWVMLNPSTADADRDDNTIRKCMAFARRNGFGGISVVNLFAWRATDPKNLPSVASEAIGPLNDGHIQAQTFRRQVVVAWGNNGQRFNRGDTVLADLRRMQRDVSHLGLTGVNQPGHPLYVPLARKFIPYPFKESA